MEERERHSYMQYLTDQIITNEQEEFENKIRFKRPKLFLQSVNACIPSPEL